MRFSWGRSAAWKRGCQRRSHASAVLAVSWRALARSSQLRGGSRCSLHNSAMDSALAELRRRAARAENRRTETGIPRVAMVRGEIPEHQLAAVYEPMINLILQGGKTLTIGGQAYRYDPAHYFVMSIDVPATGTVHPDRDGQPYLAVALTLDPDVLAELLDELPTPAPGTHAERGF